MSVCLVVVVEISLACQIVLSSEEEKILFYY